MSVDDLAACLDEQHQDCAFGHHLDLTPIAGCCSRLGSNIIEETAEPVFRRLINERGQIDIVGGNWKRETEVTFSPLRGAFDHRVYHFFALLKILQNRSDI